MRITTLAVLTALVAIGGHFAQRPGDVPGAVKVTVGVTAYSFGLLLLAQADEGLALAFAVLVLITVLMYYGVAINKRLGFLGGK